MKETYTIPESERENVLKILARYQKKAMAYGTSLTVDAGEPYATKRNVYEECIDYTTGTFSHSKVGEQMIEVFDLSIEGEIIRNGTTRSLRRLSTWMAAISSLLSRMKRIRHGRS